MALDDKDVNKIGEIVEGKVGEIVEVKVSKEIGLLRLEMNQRFDQTDKKIDTSHHELLDKIGEIKTMETEDIQALTDDVVKIKKKIAFQ